MSIAGLAAVGLAATSIYRHERFGSNAYDLGIYDQTIWGYSQLAPTMSNTVRGTPNLFVNHWVPGDERFRESCPASSRSRAEESVPLAQGDVARPRNLAVHYS